MKPDISEFSYGFAIVDELINSLHFPLIAAPIFPSLNEEGQSGIGYDVRLNGPTVPLFLQFKLSNRMVRRNCRECKSGHFGVPFYRMKLRPTKHSSQHPSLLSLESAGNEVYYVAPIFSRPSEFNDAYLNRQVLNRSVFVRPMAIGPLPDDKAHHIAFQDSILGYFYSEPVKLNGRLGIEQLTGRVLDRLESPRQSFASDDSYTQLGELMLNILFETTLQRPAWRDVNVEGIRQGLQGVKLVAYLSRHFFDLELLLISKRS